MKKSEAERECVKYIREEVFEGCEVEIVFRCGRIR